MRESWLTPSFCSIHYLLSHIDNAIQFGEDAEVKVKEFDPDFGAADADDEDGQFWAYCKLGGVSAGLVHVCTAHLLRQQNL